LDEGFSQKENKSIKISDWQIPAIGKIKQLLLPISPVHQIGKVKQFPESGRQYLKNLR
jgi:hypothetical protein